MTMAGSTGGTGAGNETIRSEFVTGLVNAHAVEKQARELIERQIERVKNYPEVAARLRQHLDETNAQEERLDQLLAQFNESRSMMKDMALQFAANMGAMVHGSADDEILKNTFANLAFENYEIAAYQSLITMARAGGFTQAERVLQQSLREEENMAEWIRTHVDDVTQKYLMLKQSDERADR